MKHLISLLFLCISISAFPQKTVTFPSPETIATKQDVNLKVDSLAKVLRSEIGNNKPDTPALPNCEHGLELVETTKESGSGLEFNFYSVGVKRIIAVVFNSSGSEILRHTIGNITRDRLWLPFSLSPGSYQLRIQNADCNAISEFKPFTIPGETGGVIVDPGSEDREAPTAPTGFFNPGVFQHVENGKLYEWIPSENLSVQVQNGKVRLIAPQTKPSWSGANTCRRFLLGDLYDNPLPADEEAALFSDGLGLAPGAYGFRIIYVNAKSLEEVKSQIWYKIGDGDGGGHDHSAQMETVYLSITGADPIGTGVKVPADLYRASWLPHYQLLPYDLKLPADKAFGTTRYIVGIPREQLFKKFTHLQYRYSWLDTVPNEKKWNNLQAHDHSEQLVQPDWVINHATLDKNFITLGELAENYGNLENDCPRCYEKAEEVFRGVYGRYQREQGVKSPAETRVYDDYFGALYGYSLEVPFTAAKVDLRKGLSSVSNARKAFLDGSFAECNYFSRGAYEYRNYRIGGYIGNLFSTLQGTKFYSNIYALEKVNLAVPDRKILKNGWQTGEALGQDILTGRGVFLRLKLPGGDMLRIEPNTWPTHTMIAESFYHLLLGNDYILWNSNIPMSVDLAHFEQSWYGGQDDWKTKWQPAGKAAVTYNPNDPNHPRKGKGAEGSIFPELPLLGETGAFIGAWLYSQIAGDNDRVSRSVKYCDFSVNGRQFSPSKGAKGDGSLSSRISQNPGQDWIVTASEQKAPVCICTEGAKGRAVIYQNPAAGLTESQVINVSGQNLNVTGNRLNVIGL